ncbi:MAG: glycosyltransferase family 2 protein [Bacillota bacterium]
MLVSVIIPVHNQLAYTRQCLNSLFVTENGIRQEVIVIDNASSDGTASYLQEKGRRLKTIRNSTNDGFARACNLGARAAAGRYLCFLNNDTICQSGWLSSLLALIESEPRIGVVGSKLLYPDGTVQHAGVVISGENPIVPVLIYQGAPAKAPYVNKTRDFQAVSGASMLVRRQVFEAAGGFDEGYINGCEDLDFCFEVRRLGYRIVYTPASVLCHFESSTPGRHRYILENRARLQAKWLGKITADAAQYYRQDGFDQVPHFFNASRKMRQIKG